MSNYQVIDKKIKFKNKAGNLVHIPIDNKIQIKEKLDKLKKSTVPGDITEAKVGDALITTGKLKGLNTQVYDGNSTKGDKFGDIDAHTANEFIEAKSTYGAVKASQAAKYLDPYNPQFMNYEAKTVIIFVDGPFPSYGQKYDAIMALSKGSGIKVKFINNIDDLINSLE